LCAHLTKVDYFLFRKNRRYCKELSSPQGQTTIMEFEIILACDSANGIGIDRSELTDPKASTIPWRIAEDMKFFRETTSVVPTPIQDPVQNSALPDTLPTPTTKKMNALIVGRLTADTFPKPLPNRVTVVVTSDPSYRSSEGFIPVKSLDDALNYLAKRDDIHKVFVAGGAKLCNDAIDHRRCRGVYLNRIDHDYKCSVVLSSTFMSRLDTSFEVDTQTCASVLCKVLNSNVNITYNHLVYVNREEIAYLDMLQRIIDTGDYRETRNAKTYSVFGEKLVFDLANGFPCLTTKKMFHRGVIEELLFFLRGDTDTKMLEDKKVMIWHGNTTKEFMEKNNKNLEEYDMGPMYGFQWRHFGAKYEGCHKRYDDQGVDQFKQVIDLIVKDPHSRRILMTTFNPEQAEDGVLYPCHGLTVQFYVEKNNRLSLQMYQRSCDSILGAPFNILSYALLLFLVTELVNNHENRTHSEDYKPGRVIMIFGDTHIYSDTKSDHVLTAKEQISRRKRSHKFPGIRLNKRIKNLKDIESLVTSDFEVYDYISEPALKAEMYE
ncbi:bifunctional dihydrofolate reductase/thymidylate synthase, partial [Yasminevirus sp. GU-2018]